MLIALNKLSALRVLRSLRREGRSLETAPRVPLPAPDPSPRKRWTRGLVSLSWLPRDQPPSEHNPLYVAAPSAGTRLRAPWACCTTYASGLPDASFLKVEEGICLPCPELLFVELATIMSTPVHALVGYELCGTFSRDPVDPRLGPVTLGVPSVTSVERIRRFLGACGSIKGADAAAQTLDCVADDAWSPMEAICAALFALPPHELGYDLGHVALNQRHENAADLVALGCHKSRVPDIELVDTRLGFNYDGRGHLDLASIVDASDAEDAQIAGMVVRDKYVDDLRRNRELAAQGRLVLPVTSEDLFAEGGLDAVALEAAAALEAFDGRRRQSTRNAIASAPLSGLRQRLVWSLLPWAPGREAARQHRQWEERPFVPGTVIEEEIAFWP